MNDWGEIKLNQIDTGDDFWSIIDEITDDHSGFLNNRNTLIDAYKKGDLYGLYVNETDKMVIPDFKSGEYRGPLRWNYDEVMKGEKTILPGLNALLIHNLDHCKID